MTNEQYWMRRDRDAKTEFLYGCPLDLPENDLKPKPSIMRNLVIFALVAGLVTTAYFIINAFL